MVAKVAWSAVGVAALAGTVIAVANTVDTEPAPAFVTRLNGIAERPPEPPTTTTAPTTTVVVTTTAPPVTVEDHSGHGSDHSGHGRGGGHDD